MQQRELVRTVTQKGQVTIPVEIRRLLGLRANDRVVFAVRDGQVCLLAAGETLESTHGAVAPLQRPEAFDRLRTQAIDEHAAHILQEMTEDHDLP